MMRQRKNSREAEENSKEAEKKYGGKVWFYIWLQKKSINKRRKSGKTLLKINMKLEHINTAIIDTREKERIKKAQTYFASEGITHKTQELEYGDYLIDNCVVWELKEMSDFINSVLDKTLFNEVYNQSEKYPYSYLIIIWDEKLLNTYYYKNPSLKRRYRNYHQYKYGIKKSMDGAIRRCRVVCNVIITQTIKQAFYELLLQSDKCLSNKNYGGFVRPSIEYRANPCKTPLMSIGGVGEKISDRIIDTLQLECYDDLCNISYEELLTVKGVNKRMADDFWRKAHGKNQKQ